MSPILDALTRKGMKTEKDYVWMKKEGMKMEKMIIMWIMDCLQISLLTMSEFKRIDFNFYSPWNHQKTIDFLIIPGGTEIYEFT